MAQTSCINGIKGIKANDGAERITTRSNNESSRGTTVTAALVVLLSFGMGILTPSFVNMWLMTKSLAPAVYSLIEKLPSSWVVTTRQLKAQLHGSGGCSRENLANFLHENSVPGLHIVCAKEDSDALQVTMYPGSQINNSFVSRTTHKSWSHFRDLLSEDLALPFYNDFTKETSDKWTIYTANGDMIVSAPEHVETRLLEYAVMTEILQQEMILIYQGGAFVWPGVRVGFERHVKVAVPTKISSQQYQYVTLKTLSLTPLVVSVENFLSTDECDHVQNQAMPHIEYSGVSLMDKDKGKAASEFRTSQSTFLVSKGDAILENIDHRVASLTRIPRQHQESCQVLRYGLDEKYDAHTDYFDPSLYQASPDVLETIRYGERNRHATVFWYLTNLDDGGETYFPRAGGLPQPWNFVGCHEDGLKVKPEKGKVIIFYSMLPDGKTDEYSLHAACPVKQGIKWAANKWVWNEPTQYAEVF